jgi:LytS/YehU family sensor histidine kinase
MVLLPLINHALAHRPERALGDERFWIDVAVHNEKVLLTIRDQGSGFASGGASDTQIVRIRELLVALYGDSASLTFKQAVGGTEAEIEIPYEFVGGDPLT